MLSKRERNILKIFSQPHEAVRIQDLAKALGVSQRTVNDDLKGVKSFLAKQGMSLQVKKGVGLWLQAPHQQMLGQLLKHLLSHEMDPYDVHEARVYQILWLLFAAGEFVTSEQLAQALGCSRSTILKDMKTVTQWLGEHVQRKKSHGYRLQGPELPLRQKIEALLRQSLSKEDVYHMVEGIKAGTDLAVEAKIPYLTYYPVISPVVQARYRTEPKDILGLTLRWLLSLVRVSKNQLLFTDNALQQATDADTFAQGYMQICHLCQVPAYVSELAYIQGEITTKYQGEHLTALAHHLIQSISQAERFPYHEDTTLYSRLVSHLSSSLYASELDNPFHDIIQAQHDSLFVAIKAICRQHIDHETLLSDTFISYIALHFLSTRKQLMEVKKVKVVLVCASGRGAVQLIKRILETEVKDLSVVQSCSLPEAEAVIEQQSPDLVISVFPINTSLPWIQVEPIPTPENLMAIKQWCRQFASGQGHTALDDLFGFDSSRDEDISVEVILLGLRIYQQLSQYPIKEGMSFAFLSHVLLLAHRCVFNRQYHHTPSDTTGMSTLAQAFEALAIPISVGELAVLRNYMELDTISE